jgi:hypothetical protein
MVFHLNNCKNIFRPLFCHFLPNFAILRPPIFSGHELILGASFELFGRKFGHLAPVHITHFNTFHYSLLHIMSSTFLNHDRYLMKDLCCTVSNQRTIITQHTPVPVLSTNYLSNMYVAKASNLILNILYVLNC